uniref:Small ribosomal subunit protein uS5m n=1 Tax=Rhipicephalus zambeziensis TaxID=60191 RepID=A0A224Z8Y5_9ACAR
MAGLARLFGRLTLQPSTGCLTQAKASECLLKPSIAATVSADAVRGMSFFVKLTAEQLWKGVTSVSNAGRKRGRAAGSSRKIAKDLNKGQVIGVGKVNMVWPGLNAPIVRGREVVERVELPPDKEREERLIQLRNAMHSFSPPKLTPLERGWSGHRMPGRSIGPPDPVGDVTFDTFDTIVLELRIVTRMTGNLGRMRRHKALVVVGNKNGLIGFASGKANDARSALRVAKNKAVQRLRYIDRFEEHTVFHDYFTQYGPMKVWVRKKPKGYGLQCQRVFREICKLVGITDLEAKLVKCRARSASNLVRAFILGLHNQKTHQQLADEKRLHLVEYKDETDNYPRVVASPRDGCRTAAEIGRDEELDFDLVTSNGILLKERKEIEPWYVRFEPKGWENHLKKIDPYRNAYNTRLHLIHRYGKLCSFVNPEGFGEPNRKEDDSS